MRTGGKYCNPKFVELNNDPNTFSSFGTANKSLKADVVQFHLSGMGYKSTDFEIRAIEVSYRLIEENK